MKSDDLMNTSASNQLSVNDIVKNLFKLLAFKYKSHDAEFTRVTEEGMSQGQYGVRNGF